MNSLKLTEGGLSGFSGAEPRVPGSGRTRLGGGGGTTSSSRGVSDPRSVRFCNTGEAVPVRNYITITNICVHK